MKWSWVSVMMLCLMLASAFVGSRMTMVTTPNPHQGTLTMHLVLDGVNRHGYHDIAYSIKEELAKIGITVELDYRATDYFYEEVWKLFWDYTWDDSWWNGWDMVLLESWGMPNDLVWFEGMYTEWGMPQVGWNIMSWNNTKADSLLAQQFSEFDPVERRKLMLLWQNEYVHDNPCPIIYALNRTEVTNAKLTGWDPAVWFWDPTKLGWTGEENYVRYGCAEDLSSLNPMFMENHAQAATSLLMYDLLYTIERDETGVYKTRPSLASAPPTYSEGPNGLNTNVTIPLRQGVRWHDYDTSGETLDAYDVKFTFDAILDQATGNFAWLDFYPVIESVEVESDYSVVFYLKKPYVAFDSLLANPWGALILPEHGPLSTISHDLWWTHRMNSEYRSVGTGPYKFISYTGNEWELEANTDYFLGEPTIDRFLFKIYYSSSEGLKALREYYTIAFGDCWEATGPQIEEMRNDDNLNVFDAPLPCTIGLAFNLRHPILSNRYVRQAIAHAINYPHIVDDILPLYGLGGHIQATPVWRSIEWAYPTPAEEVLYNIGPYEYNIAKAQQYMNMWKYSLAENTGTLNPTPPPPYNPDPDLVALGPVGDGDFSGLVELDDFAIWAKNVGTYPDDWPWYPGQDIDPDYDNTGYVEMADFYRWRENVGEYYPFYGAR